MPLRTTRFVTLGSDCCVDFKSHPNRHDCCSASGIAGEVATVTQVKLRVPKVHPVIKSVGHPASLQECCCLSNSTVLSLLVISLRHFDSQTDPRTIAATVILASCYPKMPHPKDRSVVSELLLSDSQQHNAPIILTKKSVLAVVHQVISRLELSNWLLKKLTAMRSYNTIFPSSNAAIDLTVGEESRASFFLTGSNHILQVTINTLLSLLWSAFSMLLVLKMLRSLRLGVVFDGGGNIGIVFPNCRSDILDPEDVAKELLKSLNFYYLPKQSGCYNRTATNSHWHNHFDGRRTVSDIRKLLVSRGYSELISPSVISSISQTTWSGVAISLTNPIAKRTNKLRTHIIDSWTDIKLPNTNSRFFEVGSTYFGKQTVVLDTRPLQSQSLAVLSYKMSSISSWENQTTNASSCCLRFDLENVFRLCGKTYNTKITSHPLLNPMTSDAIITNGKTIGYIGELRKTSIGPNKMIHPVVFELLLDDLTNSSTTTSSNNSSVSYPAVTVRDISFVCWTDIKAQVLIDSVFAVSRKEIVRQINAIELFNEYQRQHQLTLGLRVTFVGIQYSEATTKAVMSLSNHLTRTNQVRMDRTLYSEINDR